MLLSNKNRGEALRVAIRLMVISSVISINALIMQYIIYTNLEQGVVYKNKDLVKLDVIVYLVNLFSALSGLFFIVLFIAWFYRAYANILTLDKWLSDSKYWAIFAWIVPVYSLFMPYRMMKNMTQSALFFIKKNTGFALKRYKENGLLFLWLTFIAIHFMGLFKYRLAVDEEMISMVVVGLVIKIFVLIALFFFSRFYRFYSRLEHVMIRIENRPKPVEEEALATPNHTIG